MKTPDDSDDDHAEDDGDFDGMSHRILAVSQRTCKYDYIQITTTTPVQRWISWRMDMQALQIPTPVCLARPGPEACSLISGPGIFFSKDRREEVIEVEEDSEIIVIPGQDGPVKLMTQSQWMKGCPEGGEQGFLFSLYNELSHDPCQCPNECGYSVARNKSHFFPVLVSQSTLRLPMFWSLNLYSRMIFSPTHSD